MNTLQEIRERILAKIIMLEIKSGKQYLIKTWTPKKGNHYTRMIFQLYVEKMLWPSFKFLNSDGYYPLYTNDLIVKINGIDHDLSGKV
jgi:hypothetical protein